LEDGKSVSGRVEFDDGFVSIDHCWDGVDTLFKKVDQ